MASPTTIEKWMPPAGLPRPLTIHTSSTNWSDSDMKTPENEGSDMLPSVSLLLPGLNARERNKNIDLLANSLKGAGLL